jgi:hypothetical protein
VNKRQAIAVAVAFAAGGVIGGIIGFAWHAPGRSTTWGDIRDWATAAAVVLGFPALLYQLNLQRLQFAGEAKRNIARDDLLDHQRRELQRNEHLRQREQAEAVDLIWSAGGQNASAAEVTNGFRRPISNVACQLDRGHGRMLRPERVNEMAYYAASGLPAGPVPAREGVTENWRVANIRPGRQFIYVFGVSRNVDPTYLLLVRFTDDAGLHWELDHHLHLMRLDDRSDW